MTKKTSFLILSILFVNFLFCKPANSQKDPSSEASVDIAEISESLGHLIGKNLRALGLKFDINLVIKGIQDSCSNKSAPLSEDDCVQAISFLQEQDFNEKASENLKVADQFLQKNKYKQAVVELEPGKLQYKIQTKGKGQIVKEYNSPLVRYTGKYLDGTVFSCTKEAERVSLDQTIPGFSKGIIGMKEGEKRILYIHPELGYGKSGFLKPNSLLTFEIELIQADLSTSEENDLQKEKRFVSEKNISTQQAAR